MNSRSAENQQTGCGAIENAFGIRPSNCRPVKSSFIEFGGDGGRGLSPTPNALNDERLRSMRTSVRVSDVIPVGV